MNHPQEDDCFKILSFTELNMKILVARKSPFFLPDVRNILPHRLRSPATPVDGPDIKART